MKIRIDLVLVQFVLIALKLVDVIRYSWWLVLSPYLLVLTAVALLVISALALTIIHLRNK